MTTQQAKEHRVGEWATLRATSPEIAEAIFEVANYDEKLAEEIWEQQGNDEVLSDELVFFGEENFSCYMTIKGF